jgi:hypothetical protein
LKCETGCAKGEDLSPEKERGARLITESEAVRDTERNPESYRGAA